MSGTKALVGSATRYIAGRNAMQTVYWRGTNTASESPNKFIKVSKTLQFKTFPPARAMVQGRNNTSVRF